MRTFTPTITVVPTALKLVEGMPFTVHGVEFSPDSNITVYGNGIVLLNTKASTVGTFNIQSSYSAGNPLAYIISISKGNYIEVQALDNETNTKSNMVYVYFC